MTPFARGLGFGLGSALVISAAAGFWVGSETETRLIVAADDIPEGAVITVGMLDVRHVPVRFLSKRKLGVTNVAAVMGQQAPQAMRTGDFLDPTHFGTNADGCLVEARAVATSLRLPDAATLEFLSRLERSVR